MRNEKGQVVLILVLVMTVALAIGISVIQRSLSDISTSSKVEQSARAFSAAEAGIEKAMQSNSSSTGAITLNNDSSIQEVLVNSIPAAGTALEYPPIAKEEMAQVWLADPTSSTFPSCDTGKICYNQTSFDVYFGIPNTTDKPAIEVTVVSWDGTLSPPGYVSTKSFFDSDSVRATTNNFTVATCSNPSVLTNANTGTNQFYCRVSVNAPNQPILVRMRLLYVSTSQPVAVGPISGYSLPVQARIFTATGVSGQTQRKVQVFRLDSVVPPFFDYAIFSAGAISK